MSQNIRHYLALRRFIEGMNHSQAKLDLRRQIASLIETILKKVFHLEAVTLIEDEEQTPKITVIRRDKTNF